MVGGWRRAFCTTIPKEKQTMLSTNKQDQHQHQHQHQHQQRNKSKFGFFSNPSTPRLKSHLVSSTGLRCRTTASTTTTTTTASEPNSPKLHCKTAASLFQSLNSSSPRSPLSFSLFKTSSRLSKSGRCGICTQSVKTGQGTAIFTAECSHEFHFPCVSVHVSKQRCLACPVCSALWKEPPLLSPHNNNNNNQRPEIQEDTKKRDLKVYNDDEPLMSPTAGGRFIPIPESDENDEDNEEFQGFFVNPTPPTPETPINSRTVEVRLLPESAVVSTGRSYETYVVVLKVKAPPSPAAIEGRMSPLMSPAMRAPIDLVTVLDVSEGMNGAKIQMMKRAMRLVMSSLSSNDRLCIVAFSATSKRLLPLRRMTATGRRSAGKIVDALRCVGKGACPSDALKKAAKVLEDRRERNPVATIMLLSDGHDDPKSTKSSNQIRPFSAVASTRFAHVNIPVQSFGFGETPDDDVFTKRVEGLLNVVVQDARLQLGFSTGSAPGEIVAVYSCANRPSLLGPGSIRLGDLYAEEERVLLIELKVPISSLGSHHVLSVRSLYKDPPSQELIYTKEQALLVPRPHAVRSSSPNIQRLRSLFLTTRAIAESRRLIENNNDFTGAHRLLSSARAALKQSASAEEYLRGLEAELAELNSGWQKQVQMQRQRAVGWEGAYVDERGEPLTPTSAWRAAERLAKVAIMRKSLNRVSDLHGFENARF